MQTKTETTLNKNYLFDENKNVNGCFYFFKTITPTNPNLVKTKMLLVNNDISEFYKMLENYCYVVAKIQSHADKTMRKDNKQFKQIAVKKVLRFFKNMTTRKTKDTLPLKANELRLILNEFFSFKINGFLQEKQVSNFVIENAKTKVSTTTTERINQKEIKNSLFADLFNGSNVGYKNKYQKNDINTIRRKRNVLAIAEYKKQINFLKTKPSENNNVLISSMQDRINALRQEKPRKKDLSLIPKLECNKAHVLNRMAIRLLKRGRNIKKPIKVSCGYSIAKISHVAGYTA